MSELPTEKHENPFDVNRDTPAPGKHIGREEEAKLALEHTQISRASAWLLTIAFLITIFAVPLWQGVYEVRSNLAARRAEAKNGATPATGVLPRPLEAVQELPAWEQIRRVRSWQEAWSLIPDAGRLKTHEDDLEDESLLSQWLLPRAQTVLLRAGVGNEQVYLGRRDERRHQWLFYRPDVDYLTSKGFLDPALQRVRARAGDTSTEAVQPDPVRAIADFHRQLRARDIELILFPMPVKPMIEAEKLSARYETNISELHNPLQNPSYAQFLQSLRKSGVTVFDPTPILRNEKARMGSAFLETDTHWKPEVMQRVARELAALIIQETALEPGQTEYSRRAKTIQNLGDTATMLSLLDNQQMFDKQSVQIQQVFDPSGALWRSDKDAQVLLLGDSFCNIYSLAGMGWGEGAGFGAQLSFELRQPVDAVVVNAGGSHTSRQRLVGEMKRDRNRLAGKRVVIWEFSMRDLLIGDWKIFRLPD